MTLFDNGNGEISDAAFGLDTTAALNNEPSLMESVGNVVTKGIPLTALSIVNSFANTAIELQNWLGLDIPKFGTEAELNAIGATDYLDYYNKHQQGIEAAGLVVGSFIPGMAGIKALKLAQAGKMGAVMARATGFFSGIKDAAVAQAAQEVAAGDAALFGQLGAYKLKAIAAGFGDQALQALAFETAVAGTMKASPLLDNQDFGDIATNMFYGTLVGGTVGGVLEGFFVNSLIRKAEVLADTSTKAAELATRYGYAPGSSFAGTSIAGDRVALLMDSIDKIPTDLAGTLASKKIADTTNRAVLDSRRMLSELAGKGNEDLSTGLFDSLIAMKAAGQGKEDIFEKLSGLAKISRIDDEASIPLGDTFYINKFAAKAGPVDWSELISTTPAASADVSQRFALRPLATSPMIAKATDTYTATNGTTLPLYRTATEAYADGADIYIDSKLVLHVNPDAPNLVGQVARPGESRALSTKEEATRTAEGAVQLPADSQPLYGAPIILNRFTHDITSDAIPVVGDYGPTRLVAQGLLYGGKLSPQTVTSVLDAQTPTIDANARYLWAARRGIKNGDTITTTDLPMMEQLYRGATTSGQDFTTYMDGLRQRGVTFANGDDLPYSASELLNSIQGTKSDLIHDLIAANPKMSTEEIARRAAVSEKYIADPAASTMKQSDYLLDPEMSGVVNHIKLQYDVGNTHIADGQILRGLMDSQYRIKVIQDAADTAMARYFGADWLNYKVNNLGAKDANIEGTGAKFLTFSNSEYGTLGQQTERIGRFLTERIQREKAAFSDILAPHANAIRQDEAVGGSAAAELGAFVNVRRRTGEKYVFMPADIATTYWRTADTVVLRDSLVKDRAGNIVDWNKDFTPAGFLPGAATVETGVRVPEKSLHTFYDLSPLVANWERAQASINDNIAIARNNWYSAQGISRNIDVGILHAPAIDTSKYPYFALVRARPGTAFSDDSISMITAASQKDLEQKMASLRSDYDIYTKDMVADYHKAIGDYQYDRNFMDNRVNSDLTRRGILNDVFPDTRADTIINQYVDYNTRNTTRLLRDYVELGNSQVFAEIEAMGAKFTGAATSQTGILSKFFARSQENPYESYRKTALSIGPREEYRLWNDAQEKLESFASTAANTAVSALHSVNDGILPLQEASSVMERFGLGNAYAAAIDQLNAYYNIANKLPPTRILSRIVAAGNLFQSATAIRLDAWQSLINIISAPILTAAEGNSVLGKLASGALSTELPDGSGRKVLSVTKAIFGAVQDWWDPTMRAQWFPLLTRMNITRESTNEYFMAVQNLAIPKSGSNLEKVMEGVNAAVEVGAKFTGSQWSENFVRTIAAFTAKRIFEDAGYTGTDLIDQMGTFVNRTHGNYIASQRPVAFQGPIGQAMGLFQTYQFNFFQQMFRYINDGEAKTLAIGAALQTGLFGLQGLPGFQMLNQHIIGNAAGNPTHADLYSTTTNFFDKKLGDWLLYGTASNVLGTGLYSRGDINPRSISVLPINPLDYPAVSGAINFMSNLLSTVDKVAQGGSLSASLMQGLEHNGISRPLSGLGQLMQGYVSTAKGDLVSATRPSMGDGTSGWSDVISAANFARIMGARPLDEAINMDMLYRSTVYQAKDASRMERLGAAVKEDLVGNTPLDLAKLDGFLKSYTNAGGEIQHFGQELMRWTQEANVSKANEIFRNLQKPINQTMMTIMGGVPLPDFYNRGNTAAVPNVVAPPTQLPIGNATRSGMVPSLVQ